MAENGMIKIGLATNVITRLKMLQCGSPLYLELVRHYRLPGDLAMVLERKLHRMLKPKRKQGEWYTSTIEEVEQIIAEILGSPLSNEK